MDLRYPVTRYVYRPLSLPAASLLARTRVDPVQVTWFSAGSALAGGAAFGSGMYVLGAALTFLGVITDCIDGDLARITGRTSRRGAFLDSVLDRWTDGALILGLTLSDPDRYGLVGALALLVSLITSYTRARAQSLGTDCPDGVGGRDARLLLLIMAALFDAVFLGLVLIAVLGFVTSIHRTVVASMALARLDRDDLPVR